MTPAPHRSGREQYIVGWMVVVTRGGRATRRANIGLLPATTTSGRVNLLPRNALFHIARQNSPAILPHHSFRSPPPAHPRTAGKLHMPSPAITRLLPPRCCACPDRRDAAGVAPVSRYSTVTRATPGGLRPAAHAQPPVPYLLTCRRHYLPPTLPPFHSMPQPRHSCCMD